jgi:prepilin-type N-terminal cleavage/methylation domain-containing protein
MRPELRRRASANGFTLIELIVALVIVAVVTLQLLAMFSSQQKTSIAEKRVVEIQEDVRLVADMMLTDVRMAGFMVSRVVGLSSVDGGTGGPDAVCVSDPGWADASVANANTRFTPTSLFADLGASAGTVELVTGDMDIDGDGSGDFAVGGGIILADGAKSHCARITQISSGDVDFVPPTPFGFALTTADGRAVPAVIYELSGSQLLRNNEILARQLEDLQVEFGVDANGDGQIAGTEFPIHDLDGSDTSLIRRVRLSVISRTSLEDPSLTGPGRQAAGNRTAAGAPDAFRRRRVTVVTAPRNLL